jgi:hypothetical protein
MPITFRRKAWIIPAAQFEPFSPTTRYMLFGLSLIYLLIYPARNMPSHGDGVHEAVEGIDGDLFHPPLGERRHNVKGRHPTGSKPFFLPLFTGVPRGCYEL